MGVSFLHVTDDVQNPTKGLAPGFAGNSRYQVLLNNGWIDPRRDFYITHQASPIKVALARLTETVIAKFVL